MKLLSIFLVRFALPYNILHPTYIIEETCSSQVETLLMFISMGGL